MSGELLACSALPQRRRFQPETGGSGPASGSTSLTEPGSARAAFILQGIDDIPGLRANHAVDAQIVIVLQLFDRRFGPGAEASVDAAGIEADCAHPALQT